MIFILRQNEHFKFSETQIRSLGLLKEIKIDSITKNNQFFSKQELSLLNEAQSDLTKLKNDLRNFEQIKKLSERLLKDRNEKEKWETFSVELLLKQNGILIKIFLVFLLII